MSKAFGWHASSYEVQIVDSKDPLAQLEASKTSIKDLFKDVKQLLERLPLRWKNALEWKASLIQCSLKFAALINML